MSLYQEEYPQIYPAREIVNSSAYPSAPYEPKEPKPFDMQPPSKFPGLGKHLKGLSICVLCAIISLVLCFVAFSPLFSFLLIAFGFGALVFIYKVYSSITLSKTFKKRQQDYQQ